MKQKKWDCIIIGSGPAGLGAAFEYKKNFPQKSLLIVDKENYSTGGLRNDCKMNFTFPVGFPHEYWEEKQAHLYLERVKDILHPPIKSKHNLQVYQNRTKPLGVSLLEIEQAHLGTDGGLLLIKELIERLKSMGVQIELGQEVEKVQSSSILINSSELYFETLVVAPGRKGFRFLQEVMKDLDIPYLDNIVDVGIRIETKQENYPIVEDYYDPKFLFNERVRTFCTNSGCAQVVQETYYTSTGKKYFSVNGHAYSKKQANGLVNFAMLKTVNLTEPLASGQEYAEMLGLQASLLGGGRPIMQRIGDFRMGKRSKQSQFNKDLYDFSPTLKNCTPGDISLVMPSKILRVIWKALKQLDTIIPGILHPSTIMYYPEIKLYANKPKFDSNFFNVKDNIYLIGDGAGTSRGITAAWASGIRAIDGIKKDG